MKKDNQDSGSSLTTSVDDQKQVASGSNLSSNSGKNKMSLDITLSDVDIMLHPTSNDIEEATFGQTAGTTKTVVVHIKLNIPPNIDPPDRIDHMVVELRSDEVLGFSSGVYERNSPDQLLVNVESAKQLAVRKGNVYQWDIPLHINHNVAPYERSIYGRLFHKIVVTLTWAGWSALWKGGRTLSSEQMVFIAVAPRDHHALNYARTLNGHARGLGPILFHVRTRQVSVGGYLRVALSIPRAFKDAKLHALHATTIQHTTLHSRQQSTLVEACEPERFAFWKCSQDELNESIQKVEAEDYISMEGYWILRIPHDSQIRPSTATGSLAAIKHSHSLELKLVFYRDGELMAYTTRWPIKIVGCCVLRQSVKLPSYSESDPSPVPEWSRDAWDSKKYPNIHTSQTVCACGQDLDKLLAWEREGDAEQDATSVELLREAIRSASLDAMHQSNSGSNPGTPTSITGRSFSASRSRSRNRSAATSRSVSRRPSFDVTQIEEEFNEQTDGEEGRIEQNRTSSDLEWDEVEEVVRRAEEEEQLRHNQKMAQLYTPPPIKSKS